jgi:outer membrane receptor for ferrienterochelin and colicins
MHLLVRRALMLRLHGAAYIAAALSIACAAAVLPAHAQTSTVAVRVAGTDGVIADARIATGTIIAITDDTGEATLRLPAGEHLLRIEALGFLPATRTLIVAAGRDTTLAITLETEALEHEEIIVSSTRTGRRIDDEPIRVEVIGREEVEEKLLMTPGDISMLLNETAGLRVQPTGSPLGGAGVRIQGLRGRYTQILTDGLPLHGAQAGALGPLQIPPMDLAQVEVIKGAASALYGAAALGGVVNLISRRPGEEGEHEALLNQTSLGGTDAILFSSGPLGGAWGYSLLAGGHRQPRSDIDEDGWADLPGYRRALVRPRFFRNDEESGRSLLLTIGGMVEDREGGTLPGRVTPAGATVREALDTRQLDGGIVASALLGESLRLGLRGSATAQQHDHAFAGHRERDVHATAFAEATIAGASGAHTWVLGLAFQHEEFDAENVEGFDYDHSVPGVFVQDEFDPAPWITIAASARLDRHSSFGSYLNPRLSLLLRPADEWTVRLSGGTGYFAPGPWTEETEPVGLTLVEPPVMLEAERARSAALDVGRTFGPLEVNATLFGSIVDDAVQVRLTGDRLVLHNSTAPTRTHGTELLARYHHEGLHVTATHVFLRSTEQDPGTGVRRDVPLTPRHTAGIVAAWEQEGRSRIGAELYFTGRQSLDDNPYRSTGRAHVITGLLVERRFGRARLFLNAENILDTRQTRHDPLVLPDRSPGGRWITDVWGPLEGRSFNGGVRWTF